MCAALGAATLMLTVWPALADDLPGAGEIPVEPELHYIQLATIDLRIKFSERIGRLDAVTVRAVGFRVFDKIRIAFKVYS